ncbi:MAG: hypothetical protein Q8S13_02550, partial [Dehalococcoidia bacterium]|nr:hypothetical protein [Dehalococcoidia bacterium]
MKPIAIVLAVTLLWSLSGCASKPAPEPTAPTSGVGRPPAKANGGVVRESGRAFLIGGQAERRGYALYSYLLLNGAPDESTRARYRAA